MTGPAGPPPQPNRRDDLQADWPAVLTTLVAGGTLTGDAARAAMTDVLSGAAGDARIAALLVGLASRSPTATELEAMAGAILDAAEPLELANPAGTLDIVGTGGSRRRQEAALNVSTMASVVASAAGAVVCKHGNRRATSTSGSFDALEALGVPVDLDGAGVRRCVEEVGLGFAFARRFHPAMRHAAPVRASLGIPTVFNLLGPLVHPGRVGRYVLGVGDPDTGALLASVLAGRGVTAAVVCGHDGTDEVVTTGETTVWWVRDGGVHPGVLNPGDVGVTTVDAGALTGGDPARNAEVAHDIFSGNPGPVADLVAVNAGVGLAVAGVVDNPAEGFDAATGALRSGAAAERLAALVRLGSTLTS